MDKVFLTYPQLIEILKSKGMIFNDDESALLFLQGENYYSVINGYKDLFIDDSGSYLEGTKFENIRDLFLLNRDLRSIVLRYSLIVENYIKSVIAYEFEKSHHEKNAYLNSDSYNLNANPSAVNKQIKIIRKIIEEKKSYEGPIQHYLTKYDSLPLWILVKYMTIGNISYFYSLIDEPTRNNIAKVFSKRYAKLHGNNSSFFFSAQDLSASIKAINLVRNICAHGERLYNVKFNYIRCKSLRKITGLNFQNDSLVRVFVLFKFFLTDEYFSEFSESITSIYDKYFPLFNDEVDSLILSRMGLNKSIYEDLFSRSFVLD